MATQALPDGISFDSLSEDEVLAAYELEIVGFPPDEAASLENLRFRHAQVPELFIGVFVPDGSQKRRLVGYVDATLSPFPCLTDESMSIHVPGSHTVCIHGVLVDPAFHHRGIATALLKEYVRRLDNANTEAEEIKYERAVLIVHEELRPFYEGAGFEWGGESTVVHGSKSWYEMRWTSG